MNSLDKLAQRELPYFGHGPTGLLYGLQTGNQDIEVDENLNGECDPLVEIGDELLKRPSYFEQGWTDDKRLFLRKPALLQFMEYDRKLKDALGWRVRIVDPFRPWMVQRKGFCWGAEEVIKNRAEMSREEFLDLLKKVIEGKADEKNVQLVEEYVAESEEFFSMVRPLPYDRQTFPSNISEMVITAAANFGLVDLPLDPYDNTPHSSGGVADIEWIDESGKFVNTGVAHDTQGLEAAFPFFEDRVATILAEKLKKENLESVAARKEFYRQQVERKSMLKKFLRDCGVDVEKLVTSMPYLDEVWEDIKKNRRAVVALAEDVGIKFYGLESWHGDCNDERGGVRSSKKGIVSGSGSYAIYTGQKQCAWGNAMKLWEKQV